MWKQVLSWMGRYERHLSALAMVAGFIADNLLFGRVDLLQTQLVFLAYTLACFIAIPLLHFIESRPAPAPRWRIIFPLTTQFALGGFWSGFVIFYGRSAVVGASWPFLLFLVLVFLGSEYFHRYHDRLVFTSILFFFALYSYAIFAVPVFTGVIDTPTFLLSGIFAVLIFALFTITLRLVAGNRFRGDVSRIRFGAFIVVVVMNLFYFTNILPPLPLSAVSSGIYHSISRIPGNYVGVTEAEPWQVKYLGFTPTLHVISGEELYAYSSVFAPAKLTATISHEWQWYDPVEKKWITKARVTYPIVGGRDGGYKGYSQVTITNFGSWRVNVKTNQGLLIDSIPFTALQTDTPPSVIVTTLK